MKKIKELIKELIKNFVQSNDKEESFEQMALAHEVSKENIELLRSTMNGINGEMINRANKSIEDERTSKSEIEETYKKKLKNSDFNFLRDNMKKRVSEDNINKKQLENEEGRE